MLRAIGSFVRLSTGPRAALRSQGKLLTGTKDGESRRDEKKRKEKEEKEEEEEEEKRKRRRKKGGRVRERRKRVLGLSKDPKVVRHFSVSSMWAVFPMMS